jgi:hypothetical protein
MTKLLTYTEIEDDFIAVSSKNELFTLTASGTESLQIREVTADNDYFTVKEQEFGITPAGRHFLIDRDLCSSGIATTAITTDDNNNVYVAFSDDYVKKYDANFDEIWAVGGPGTANGRFDNIAGMVILSDKLYIADQDNNRIQIHDLNGSYLATVDSSSDPIVKITGICTDGTSIFIVDQLDFNVKRYQNDVWQESLGTFGAGAGNFDFATGCCMKADGRMVIADTNNDRIVLLYTYPFSWNAAIGTAGTLPGQLTSPQYVCLDEAQNFYVTCFDFLFPTFNKFDLQVFNSSFSYIETMANGDTGVPYYMTLAGGFHINGDSLFLESFGGIEEFRLAETPYTLEIQNTATEAGDYSVTFTLTEREYVGAAENIFTIPLSATLDSFSINTYDLIELGKSRIIQQYRT